MSWHGILKKRLASESATRRVLLSMLALLIITTGLSQAQRPRSIVPQQGDEWLRGGEARMRGSEEFRKEAPYVTVKAGRGSFRLSDLRLARASGSTKLKGRIINNTGRRWERALFELRAFDERGNQLKGVEELTIFEVSDLQEDASAPLHYGYGVWLEGIPIESVYRIEAVLVNDAALENRLSDNARSESHSLSDMEE